MLVSICSDIFGHYIIHHTSICEINNKLIYKQIQFFF